MALQHVLDSAITPQTAGAPAGALAGDKYTPGGSRITFRTRVSVPNATAITAAQAAPVVIIPGIAGNIIVVKAATFNWSGGQFVDTLANQLGANFGSFTTVGASLQLAAQNGPGPGSVAFVGYTNAGNLSLVWGPAGVTQVAATNAVANADMLAGGGLVTAGYKEWQLVTAPTSANNAPANIAGQPLSFISSAAQGGGGAANRLLITVDWELHPFTV